MNYRIKLGIPEFHEFFEDLNRRAKQKKLGKDEVRLFKQLIKAINFLSTNPNHNSLNSHEIDELSRRYSKKYGKKIKVWQSYLENNTPAASRLYWVYGPQKGEITLIGVEPHPEDDKNSGYSKINLSSM